LLRQPEKLIEALSKHDMFKQLAGNPLSITNVAACYASPSMQNKSLKELYELIQQEKLAFEEDDRVSKVDSRAETKNYNQISLKVAISSSVQLLAEQSKEAESLLFFLSLLPNGLLQSQLRKMWSDNVSQLLDIIKVYEFFDTGFGDRFVLTPFVINYLRHSISAETKLNFTEKICAYYADLLKALYSFISLNTVPSKDRDGSEMKKSLSNMTANNFVKRRTKRDAPIKSKTLGL
jgi:uncharacterized membrane protein